MIVSVTHSDTRIVVIAVGGVVVADINRVAATRIVGSIAVADIETDGPGLSLAVSADDLAKISLASHLHFILNLALDVSISPIGQWFLVILGSTFIEVSSEGEKGKHQANSQQSTQHKILLISEWMGICVQVKKK